MNQPTASLIRELVRSARMALAAVSKWVDEEQLQGGIKPPPEIEHNISRPELKQ
jgi:hypothetical protein